MPDDGLNAVVVEHERHEHQEGISKAAQLVKRVPDPLEGHADRVLRARFTRDEGRRRLRDPQEQWNREHEPPDGHADKRQLDRRDGAGNAERGRHQDPEQIENKHDSAAEVAESVRGRGHPVDFVWRGDMRQQRIVEHEACGDGEVGNHEDHQRRLPFAPIDASHHEGRDDADAHEQRQQPLLQRAIVGQGAENRAEHGDDGHGDRRRPGEPRGRNAGGKSAAATELKKSGKTAVMTVD
jgi:hypothetical protein